MRKMKIQVPSPVESPQVWRKGCLKVCSVPFFPSDDNVLENLEKGLETVNISNETSGMKLKITNQIQGNYLEKFYAFFF